MPFQFRVVFGGFCAFAPFRNRKRMYVFLIDRRGRIENPLPVAPHFPIVRFDLDDLADTQPKSDVAVGVWQLNNFHLEFLPGGKLQPDALRYQCFDPGTDDHTSEASQHDHSCFTNVVSLERACRGRDLPRPGELDPRFLTPRLAREQAELIAARFLINVGLVKAGGVSSSDDSLVTWRFRPFLGRTLSTDHRQLASASIEVEMDVKATFIDLKACDLETGSAQGNLRFRPRRQGNRVEIFVMNEEVDQIMGAPNLPAPVRGKPRLEDRIFESYAKLFVLPPSPVEMPIPVAAVFTSISGTAGAGGSPPCSPARTQSVSAAGATGDLSRGVRLTSSQAESDLVIIREGETHALLVGVKEFLVRFGYSAGGVLVDEGLEGETLEALLLFKQFNGLPLSHDVDRETLKVMSQPRCGLRDVFRGARSEPPCPWPDEVLTYEFSADSGPWSSAQEQRRVFEALERAIDEWRGLLVGLVELRRVARGGQVLVRWLREDPDGAMGDDRIAHADYPVACYRVQGGLPRPVHFDLAQPWGIGSGNFFDIESVMAHEFGHVLGLVHIPSTTLAVMNPNFFRQDVSRREPTASDEADLEALYEEVRSRRRALLALAGRGGGPPGPGPRPPRR